MCNVTRVSTYAHVCAAHTTVEVQQPGTHEHAHCPVYIRVYDFRTVGNTYSNRPLCMRVIWVAAVIEMVQATLVVETVHCVELSRPLILAIVY